MKPKTAKIDFLGIAAPRCGSTWIAECLRRHPEIDFPIPLSGSKETLNVFSNWEDKEMNYFCVGEFCDPNTRPYSTWDKGWDWYLSRFPEVRDGAVRGEYTPDYFCYSGAAEAIHQALPEAKLIISLRNPPDMLLSVSRLLENSDLRPAMSFEQAVERGLFLERGFYFRLLEPFFRLFPRQQIHVILYDDIESDPAGVVRGLYAFLGVDEGFVPDALHRRVNRILKAKPGPVTSLVNAALGALKRAGFGHLAHVLATHRRLNRWYMKFNSVETSSPGMKPETREKLRGYYREDLLALQDLIGRDLSAWL